MRNDPARRCPTNRKAEPIEYPIRNSWSVTRRGFLQTIAGTTVAFALPKPASAAVDAPAYWFLDRKSGSYWHVDDPVLWSLRNAQQPILARASGRLLTLTPADRERIIRLVVRRCGLDLIEVIDDEIVVHQWGQNGRADLRPFLKERRMARHEVWVEFRDRKRERFEMLRGDRLLYGDTRAPEWLPVRLHWQLDLYLSKWRRRDRTDADDWTAAPGSESGFAWDGVEDDGIPWTVLKSVWRRTDGPPCPNCDLPTIWTNFGNVRSGYYCRSASFTFACGACRRWFDDDRTEDAEEWMLANIDDSLLPQYRLGHNGKRNEWRPPTS